MNCGSVSEVVHIDPIVHEKVTKMWLPLCYVSASFLDMFIALRFTFNIGCGPRDVATILGLQLEIRV